MKNMKKILTLSVLALATSSVFAQDDVVKNVRFGLKITPSVNWYKPDGKIIEGNGAGVKFGGGLILEFRLAKVASFVTGVQLDMDGGKVKYNNGGVNIPSANTVSYYYNNPDDKIVKYSDTYKNDPTYTHYQLNERQYKVTYVTIPLALKLKTKEIGTMTYFGQVGINTSIRWKAVANDKVTIINDQINELTATDSKSKVNITKDMNLFKETLTFGLGTEMNLSGSTSLTFGLNFDLGFTNVVKSQSDYLEKRTNRSNYNPNTASADFDAIHMPQVLKSNAVVLTIGVLF
jgi:opacity protein-like surface antigen